MSLSTIESDYTPKDFLQKLLGNRLKQQNVEEQPLRKIHINGNSQTLPGLIHHNQISEKTPNSVQNLKSPKKKNPQNEVSEQKNSHCLKQNLIQETKNQQSPQRIIQKKQNPQKISCNRAQVQSASIDKQKINLKKDEHQNLLIQKAMVLLKASLKGKIQNNEIQGILNKIQSGIKNPLEFDKIVIDSQSDNKNLQGKFTSQDKFKHQIKLRSTSLFAKKLNQNLTSKRFHSQKKIQILPKTKKQRKNLIQKTKKQILSSVKKMKQLFFLNEKSLKMTKRT